ncbi:MAG: glycosyltransferase, partial [Candidatus Kerfeldbacteria bacterium]|nr:glycosyltransferase [Candidatus Kerfeldbacteria bacterium]
PEKQNLVALATSLGCERQVVFHGQIPDEKKWPLIDSSSVAVLVPKALEEGSDVEGLGLFLVEAASRGLALIGSNTGGIPDVVHDRQTGCVVDPEHTEALVESLSFLLASPEQAQRLGAQARDLASSEFRFGHRFSRLLTMAEPIAPAVQPLISVIIPVYETARLLPETLHSLFEQTWRKLEVIIVDDGSTDDVAEAIKPWAERVTYIRQENRGAPSARNKGASVSHGQFLFFLDADTVLQLKCLENMYRVLATHPAAAYAYADFRFGPKNFHGHDFDAPALRRLNYIHTSSLIRRDAFPGFDPDLKKFQDWDLWLTMLEQGKKGIWCPERLFWVRQRSGGMSQWLPKIAYQLPWIGQGHGHASIRRYRQGEAIIRKKHGLD